MNRIEVQRDKRLIRRWLKGDKSAFEELWLKHRPGIWALAKRWAGKNAEDIVQAVALALIRRVGQWKGESAFSSWLFMVVYSEFCMWLRREKRHRGEPLYMWEDRAEAPSHENEVNARLIGQKMMGKLRKVDKLYRQAMVISLDPDGLVAGAKRRRKSVPAVKSRLFRFRNHVAMREIKRAVNE